VDPGGTSAVSNGAHSEVRNPPKLLLRLSGLKFDDDDDDDDEDDDDCYVALPPIVPLSC